MAQIGDTYYSSLPDAVSAANGGDTIELLKDLDISSDSRWYIEFNKTDTENNPVTIDFNNKSIIFHMAGDRDTRKDFLVMESGQLVLENGSLHGTDLPSLKMMGDYQDGQTAADVQKETKLTCSNMKIDDFQLVGYAGKVGFDDPGNMHPDWRHLFVQKSILNECIFNGISASITDSLVNNAEYWDYEDGDTSYKCNLDFVNSVLKNDDTSNKHPLNPSTKATFSNTLTINSLSASFVPGNIMWTWGRGESLTDPFWGGVVGSYSSSFMDFGSIDNHYVSPEPIYLISNTPTKFIGQNNNGYSFATTGDGKVLAAQDIPTMAKGATQDQNGNPTSSADQYMFVPGDADITLKFQDHADVPVNIAFSYESEGYHSTTANYSLKDGGTTPSFPLPAWTITGYDEENKEIIKEPTLPDQLSVTASTGDQTLDSQYTFAITECKRSEDGTHLSITVTATKLDPDQEYTVVYDANGGSNAPGPATYTSSNSLIEPDASQMTKRGYDFSGKWFLDQDCKIPFNYFDKSLGSAIGTLSSRGFVGTNNTITLYAGWQPKTYYIVYVLDPSRSGMISGSPDPEYKGVTVGSNIGDQPNMDHVYCYDDNMVFTGWYLDKECTTLFNYFGKNLDSELLDVFEKYAVLDSDDSYVLTLYGGWKEKDYQIDFDANLPEGATDKANNIPENEMIKINSEITEPSVDPTYEDMEFQGWYLDKECTKPFNYFNKPLSESNAESIGFDKDDKLTLYAGWDYRTYTLTYEANGGIWSDGSKEQKVTTANDKQQIILSDLPTRPGYKFKYWEGSIFYQGEPYQGDGTLNQFNHYISHTMKAHWEPKVYTVKYDVNSSKASGAPDSAKVKFDQDAINKPDTSRMTNEGKTFTGWYLDSACKVPFDYFNKKMDENTLNSLTKAGVIDSNDTITLYAGWKAAAAPSVTPSATASTPAKTSNGSIFFPITSAQKFIPATGAGGGK